MPLVPTECFPRRCFTHFPTVIRASPLGGNAVGTVMDSLSLALAKHEEREREEARYNEEAGFQGGMPEEIESKLTLACQEIKMTLLCAAAGGGRGPPDEDVD